MAISFTDEELLFITQVISQTTWKPNQATGCIRAAAILKKVEDFIKNRQKEDDKKE